MIHSYSTKLVAFIAMAFFSGVVLTSCTKDSVDTSEPIFYIEGEPTGLTVDVNSKTQEYTVRSNRPWKVVAQDTSSWVSVFPAEGNDDGKISFVVKANSAFSTRSTNFKFVVDGTEQPVLFRIDQAANIPYITLKNAGTTLSLSPGGEEVSLAVTANVAWIYELDDASWLTQKTLSSSQLVLTALPNTGAIARTCTIRITSVVYPTLVQTIIVTQPSSVVTILAEDFSWLTYGNAVTYTTTGETRYDVWTEAEKAKGWYSTPVAASNNEQLCYSRPGFVKLGKTSFGGDLISPALSAVVGTQNLLVTFKACAYVSSSGTKDDNLLLVSVVGPGAVSVGSFTIDNYPNSTKLENGSDYNVWAPAIAQRQFLITGATSETKIKFLGNAYELTGVGAGKNRIFLDDIKVIVQ